MINTTPTDGPDNGMITINSDGTYTYTPDSGFVGMDTIEYVVCDDGNPIACDTATLIVNITPPNDDNEAYANDDAGLG